MKLNDIFRQIAKENNTTPKEIKREIQKAIDVVTNSDNPQVRDYLKDIPKKGAKPTPEEFIAYCVDEAKRKRRLS